MSSAICLRCGALQGAFSIDLRFADSGGHSAVRSHIWDQVADAEQQRAILRTLVQLAQSYMASLLCISQPRGAPRSVGSSHATLRVLICVAAAMG